jgi:hypothetical protein
VAELQHRNGPEHSIEGMQKLDVSVLLTIGEFMVHSNNTSGSAGAEKILIRKLSSDV